MFPLGHIRSRSKIFSDVSRCMTHLRKRCFKPFASWSLSRSWVLSFWYLYSLL